MRHHIERQHVVGKRMLEAVILVTVALAALSSTAGFAVEQSVSSDESRARLIAIINGDARSEAHKRRDRYRHPLETLTFFGVEPHLTVVEIWPGGQGGWYRSILEPFFAGRGHYIPVSQRSGFPQAVEAVASNSADRVLVFRAHGFMIYGQAPQRYFDAIYAMLKPGGIFGIVDHRGDEKVPQDPKAANGYVNQSHVMKLAAAAGFELLASAEINANPKDTKDHPNGLYSLPPTLQGSFPFTAARERFVEIGESDRMTLKFYKP